MGAAGCVGEIMAGYGIGFRVSIGFGDKESGWFWSRWCGGGSLKNAWSFS